MSKRPLFSSRKDKLGLPPGSLVHVGEQKAPKMQVQLLEYGAEGLIIERAVTDVSELLEAMVSPTTSWVIVSGLHDVERIGEIGTIFATPPLLIEDILNTEQRPKLQEMEDNLCLILKAFDWQPESNTVEQDQISLILGPTFVITLLERETQLLDPVRQRLRTGVSRLQRMGADYLLYAILDVIIDRYFWVLEQVETRLEVLELEIGEHPNPESLQAMYSVKREILMMQRAVWPTREAIADALRHESPLIQQTAETHLRDVYEHTVQILDMLETLRELASGMQDLYLSSLSYKMNEVMKVLTVIATIFIPLTFVTSLYGMNFTTMPELTWRFGYIFVWGVILFIALGMLAFFRQKRWL